ncbi:YgjV family protein [Dasania marina]|uniref:YgjV family protein n=1 Tax=Dasania marina TaxID=471499 RepID=UPI00035DADC3|nr:YgjV family protein [Dasania marina]|tara:strand:- start:136 stop:630 length:495 start_codon:yes stop_codon:yes gene_type:complete
MSDFALSQLLGLLGLLFDSCSAQFKQRYQVFAAMGVGSIFIAGHFYVLEQYTAAAMFAIASVRHFITIRYRSKYLYVAFVMSAIGFVSATYAGYLSLLSGAANLLMVSGSFSHTQKSMRLLLMAGASVWLIHNILIVSPVAILLEVVFLSSGVIGYYRHIYKAA